MKNPFGLIGKGLREIAPNLAKAAVSFLPGGSIIANIAGKAAVKLISETLNIDIKDENDYPTISAKIESELQNLTPEKFKALQDADLRYKVEMRKYGFKENKLVASDRKDARSFLLNTENKGIIRTAIYIGVITVSSYLIIVGGILWSLLSNSHEVDPTTMNLILAILNVISAHAGAIIGFYHSQNLMKRNDVGNGNGNDPTLKPKR